ncbi:MAG: hypothetical protein HOP28_05080, partial [Gemmatimonadales bacterium]|nr:hypothetical protein [Gemmatimonadales bacterium]
MPLRRVCVLGGSSPGGNPGYAPAATAIGRLLADNSITLICSGGSAGSIGMVVDAALAAGGKVIGVVLDLPAEPPLQI